ncbi:MAG TPA: peptide ABC transporter substrate-binding protein, partial [Candidatus Tumulicola sp.]|nr:peptide ABC transporter substrate-binding protein [Candidatus Tumulicola sp.]
MRHVAACAIALALVACSRTGSALSSGSRHAWSVPGTLRVAVVQEPRSLNPLLVTTTTDDFIDRLMFEPLLSADRRGDPVPMLAAAVPTEANGGISKDGLTITYHLRPDAAWSDGVPVTSRDVAWSWHAIVDPDNNVISRHGYDVVARVDTPDARTVVVHLKHRFAPFVNTFFAESDQPYSVAPAHVLSRYPNVNRVAFNGAPSVADGPFVFDSWTRGDRIVLRANPHFFRGRPGLERIVVEIVADENSAVNLLRTHAIDYIFQASIATYPAIAQLPDAKIVWDDMNGYEAVEFNLAHPVVSDPRVRLAIAHAIDKHAFVASLTHGQERVATEDIPHWMWAFDPAVKSHAYDVDAAKALMRQAGYTYGPGGWAEKNGTPLHLLLTTDSVDATHREESLLLQAALQRIGIALDVKYFPQAELYATAALGGILQ